MTVIDNKYLLLARVAAGGQGELWRARHRLGHLVALKLCAEHITTDPVARQRFLDQGYTANHIPSPHVLTAQDDGQTTAGEPYIVYRFIHGRDAERACIASGGRLSPQAVVALAVQVASALDAAHKVGIVHRDVKPENVLIARSGHVYLTDWGSASFRTQLGSRTLPPALPPITPVFTSPEQARGEEATPRSDIFALGVTMHRLLTGRLARDLASPLVALIQAATCPVARVRDLASDVPAEVAAIVDQATAFKVTDRYPTAATMRAELDGVLGLLASA